MKEIEKVRKTYNKRKKIGRKRKKERKKERKK